MIRSYGDRIDVSYRWSMAWFIFSEVMFFAAFFGALAVFCLVLFVRGSEGSTEKAASNRIYRVCGWTIVGSMAAIGLLMVAPDPLQARLVPLRPVFWLETLATVAFAVSWLVKGDALRPVASAGD